MSMTFDLNFDLPSDEDGNPTGLWIPLIDTAGNPVGDDLSEPAQSSIILIDGKWGTALQRHSDGLWHSTGRAKPKTWEWIIANKRNVVLVYDAEERNL
jgi:hypothetical protein